MEEAKTARSWAAALAGRVLKKPPFPERGENVGVQIAGLYAATKQVTGSQVTSGRSQNVYAQRTLRSRPSNETEQAKGGEGPYIGTSLVQTKSAKLA